MEDEQINESNLNLGIDVGSVTTNDSLKVYNSTTKRNSTITNGSVTIDTGGA